MLRIFAVMMLGIGALAPAKADVILTYASGTDLGNCIPFGCPDQYGPHMGFVYRDIDPFDLKPGDIIAFDTNSANDLALSFDLSLGATATNGDVTVDGSGYTTVASLGSGVFGDFIIGNFDIAFIVNSAFSFAGGGLIVDLLNTNGAVFDDAFGGVFSDNFNLTGGTTNGVARYFGGGSIGAEGAGTLLRDGTYADLQITIFSSEDIPAPAPLGLIGVGLLGLAAGRRRRVV